MGRGPCCDKNGLKKGPWTTEEDAMLVNFIQKHGPGNWRNLRKNAGLQRCGKSCRLRWTNYLRPDIKRGRFSLEEDNMGRAPSCDKNGLEKGPWTTEEDAMLVNYIKKHGPGNWRNLPKSAGLQRCEKSCRLRWTNYLRPDFKSGRFSFEEEETIIQLHSILGNKWSAMARHLPGRTDNDIKNYWHTHIRKRLLRMGIDPVTHALHIDHLDLSSILSSYVCNNPAAALLNLSNLLKSTQQQQITLVNPELLRLATSLLSIKQENPELCIEGGQLMMLTVFPARKDCALASFKTKFSATPFVNELDESEKSVAHTASLHTAPCVDLFLKKHERTDGASVLFGVKLRTSTPLVYDLRPEKSTGCVGVFLARKDCALALLGGELGATPLEEFQEPEKSALQTQIKIVLQDDRTDRVAVIWAPKGYGVDCFFAVVLSECKKVDFCSPKKVLVLDDPKYFTIDLTSSQDKRFLLLKKTNVSNSANQHKCPARSQGREISSSSCNALPIVTNDIAITERILWLPIKHGARVSQKDKLGLTYFFVILLLGWIPSVNAADENALLQGYTCSWICIIIGTIALVYFAYKIYSLPPPEPYLFSEKVRIWINGEMIVVELFDDEGILVGSWRCALFTANGNAVDFTEWVTNLFNFVLHIFVRQEDDVEISFNQMDDPEFIGMPMDVYLHNPDTGRLRYIGRSVPQNGVPSERDIIILMESITYELVQQFLM